MRKALRVAMVLALLSAHLAVRGEDASPASSAATTLAEELPRIPAKSPEESLASTEIHPDFELQLVAAEPAVVDPVAAAFDEDGRLFVVEMRDYPFEKDPPLGRVRLLLDRDRDGRYEESHVYADGLNWPTGVAVWNGGVFVTAAPDVLYFKDEDGDHRAEIRRKVLTGFGKGNVQGLLNGLVWGLDHRLYGASSSNGGMVHVVGGAKVESRSVQGSDFCFDPASGSLEVLAGSAQFGHGVDDHGRRYLCSNSNHAQQAVLPGRYLARNPLVAPPHAVASIAKEGGAAPVFRISQPEPWRIVRTRRRAASAERDRYPPTELVVTGFFTSASGVTIYRGDAYPEPYRGNLFVGDVGGNLIHRKRLLSGGVVQVAERADPDREFLASTDNWFRPVNFVNAPDGCLYVLDMYRETIEHPASIPDDIKAHLDLESGRERGRIYRIAPKGFRFKPIDELSSANVGELVAALGDANCWRRETAHRLLRQRADKRAVAPLRETLFSAGSPLARSCALWSLEGLGELSDADVLRGLSDPDAAVRRQAARLAEDRLASSKEVLHALTRLAVDPDPEVRMQVAFSLGCSASLESAAALARLALENAGDPWIRYAILSSCHESAAAVLSECVDAPGVEKRPGMASLLTSLSFVLGARQRREELDAAWTAIADARQTPIAQRSILIGLGEGLAQKKTSLAASAAHASQTRAVLRDALDSAARDAASPTAPLEERLLAIRLLAGDPDRLELLATLLDPKHPSEIQRSAVQAIARFDSDQAARNLLAQWGSLTPAIQSEVVEALLSRAGWIPALLDAVEAKVVAPNQLSLAQIERLRKSKDRSSRDRALEALGGPASPERGAVIARYLPALKALGEPARGRKVFERECLSCHRVAGKGHEVGPDLATIRGRTPENLATQILDPNREVLPAYLEYIVALDDGRVVTGVIAAESPSGITLRKAQGAEETILRQNIESIATNGKSLMPEGLEQKISPAEFSDLIAYLLQPPPTPR